MGMIFLFIYDGDDHGMNKCCDVTETVVSYDILYLQRVSKESVHDLPLQIKDVICYNGFVSRRSPPVTSLFLRRITGTVSKGLVGGHRVNMIRTLSKERLFHVIVTLTGQGTKARSYFVFTDILKCSL